MCISCRERFDQDILIRLQCKDKVLTKFTGTGRSFYLCNTCMKDDKKVHKALCRACKNNKKYDSDLKEIIVDVR